MDRKVHPLERQIEWRKELHAYDIICGQGRVELPHALDRKLPQAAYELRWQFVFALHRMSRCPRTGKPGRRHLHENSLQKAITGAV